VEHVKQSRAYAVLILSIVSLLLVPQSRAHAVELKAGDWNIDIGGFLNTFYTYADCSGAVVGGTALASRELGCGGLSNRSTIGNGLLPSGLGAKFSTTQNGIDIGGKFAVLAAVATDSAIGQNSVVDIRQAFFTLGTSTLGTLKLGRDYGTFGHIATLDHMTLVGAGAPIQATQRGRVTLGPIGSGISYLGTYGQISYDSPRLAGLGFTVAVVNPVGNGSTHGSGVIPQFQGEVSYKGDILKVWVGGKVQKFETLDTTVADDFTLKAVEAGAALTLWRLGLLANVQYGTGLGILSDGDQGDVDALNALGQATLTVTPTVKLGLAGGISRNEDSPAGRASLRQNINATAGAYWSPNKTLTLLGEASHTRSEAFGGAKAYLNGLAVGGILFY